MTSTNYVTINQAGLQYTLALPQDAGDCFHQSAQADGMWNHVQECLVALLSPGDVLIDIGANIGTVSIPIAASGIQVIAYEALDENVRFLDAAVRANRFEERVTIRNVAVWERADHLVLTGGSAWGRVIPGQGSIQAVALDADLPAGMRVATVKLDVEGSELHVLRGMLQLIMNQRPHIVFESNPLELGRLGSSATMLFNLLNQHGYRIYRIYRPGRFLLPGRAPQESNVCDFLVTTLGPFALRRATGHRIGFLRPRHNVRRILSWDDELVSCHLHLLAVADRLSAKVTRDPRVASRLTRWRDRYGEDPRIDIIRKGQFAETTFEAETTAADGSDR